MGTAGDRSRVRFRSRPSARWIRSSIAACHSMNSCIMRDADRFESFGGCSALRCPGLQAGRRLGQAKGDPFDQLKRQTDPRWSEPRARARSMARSMPGRKIRALSFKCAKQSPTDQRAGAGRQLNCASVRAVRDSWGILRDGQQLVVEALDVRVHRRHVSDEKATSRFSRTVERSQWLSSEVFVHRESRRQANAACRGRDRADPA